MNKFDRMYGNLLHEQGSDVYRVGIFPGAFKPPHIGHYTTALNACKNNDKVYIFVSDKSRPLTTKPTSGKDVPDSVRYSNILKSDKYTSNLLSVKTAGVARMTSATAFRAAVSLKDKVTIAKNLPDGVDKDAVYHKLMQSNDISSETYGHISIEQTMDIWNMMRPSLLQLSGMGDDDLIIKISSPSPVKDTYDLVDQLNKSESAGNIAVDLFVGE